MDNKLPQNPNTSADTSFTSNNPNTVNPPSSTKSSDDSLVEVKVNNPFSKFFNWLKSLIKNEGISIKIKPLTAIGIALALTGGGGIIGGIIGYAFPHSSPLLHRSVIFQGSMQTSSNGLVLVLPNSDLYTLRPKPNSAVNLETITEGQVLVKGNLTPEKYVVEVSEIIPLNNSSLINPASLDSLSSKTSASNSASNNLTQNQLPKLFPNLSWETAQKRVLIFTSGKRKIEQEGIYLESTVIANYPQEFLNYYSQQLADAGFKQTFISSDPAGITVTYAKDDLFLTFGVRNIYSGAGNNKRLSGYQAFLEHN